MKGQRIAFFGATQVLDSFAVDRWAAGPDKPGLASAKREDVLVDAVRAARADSDTVVVMLHWGVETATCPQEPAQQLAERLVEAGADVVVGSHAHVLQGSGYLDGAYVHYGLGNFLFYSSGGGPNTRSGVLTLTVAGRAVTDDRWDPARCPAAAPRCCAAPPPAAPPPSRPPSAPAPASTRSRSRGLGADQALVAAPAR